MIIEFNFKFQKPITHFVFYVSNSTSFILFGFRDLSHFCSDKNRLFRTYAFEFIFILDVLSNKLERIHGPLHRRVQLTDIVSF